MKSLAGLSQGRTTLVIAHRLSTVQSADRIVMVDRSGIVEQGRHHDLIRQGGAYQRLQAVHLSRAN